MEVITTKYDFLIIGGGVIGLTIALEVKNKFGGSVVLIEKENDIATHASGRNSGVIHAGFYYEKSSLKSKLTKEGNILMHQYCADKGIYVNRCGKVVVCANDKDLPVLDELYSRAINNSVVIEKITEKDVSEIDSNVQTYQKALWSPTTSSIDPHTVTSNLLADCKNQGIDILLDTKYLKRGASKDYVLTSKGKITAGYVINSAGLYADKIAKDYGFAKHYEIVPFKGLYLYVNNMLNKPKVHIYPVPDLDYPFLGVHFTLTVDGDVKIGPTAIPSFWREQYGGLSGFKFNELLDISKRNIELFINNKNNFRKISLNELKKYNQKFLAKSSKNMFKEKINLTNVKWGKPGIRAQLVNVKEKKLEMDFIYEGDSKSFHLLNAVSPAFTCSFSISKYVIDVIDKIINEKISIN